MPDWLGQANVGANGIATVTLTQQNPAVVWEVQQLSASIYGKSVSANVVIWKNNNMVAPTAILVPQVDQYGATSIGQTASGLPYLYVNASDQIQIVVSQATNGDRLTVRAQYREFNSADPNMIGR
jgi:hypothetical protein